MPSAGKNQVKLYLTPAAHNALKQNKEINGVSLSDAVEDLISEVLVPELKEQSPEFDFRA